MEEINLEDPASDSKLLLRRWLSVRSVISTASSDAIQQQEAAIDASGRICKSIGRGWTGEIFDQVGTGRILKKAIHKQESSNSPLWNDFKVHSRVEEAVARVFSHRSDLNLSVPELFDFIGPDDEGWWKENTSRWPPNLRERQHLFEAQKISPLPKIVRETLIQRYCPSAQQQAALANPANRDCLVRVYLGVRRSLQPATITDFTLRNFELDLTRAKDLGLDLARHAASMGVSLAIMHWEARTDADDVEFVLATAPTDMKLDYGTIESLPPLTSTRVLSNTRRRAVHLWLLDFNNCSDMPPTMAGVMKAADSYWRNDPYFPRPVPDTNVDWPLWNTFRNAYLEQSSRSAPPSAQENELPQAFINQLIIKAKSRLAQIQGPPRGDSMHGSFSRGGTSASIRPSGRPPLSNLFPPSLGLERSSQGVGTSSAGSAQAPPPPGPMAGPFSTARRAPTAAEADDPLTNLMAGTSLGGGGTSRGRGRGRGGKGRQYAEGP